MPTTMKYTRKPYSRIVGYITVTGLDAVRGPVKPAPKLGCVFSPPSLSFSMAGFAGQRRFWMMFRERSSSQQIRRAGLDTSKRRCRLGWQMSETSPFKFEKRLRLQACCCMPCTNVLLSCWSLTSVFRFARLDAMYLFFRLELSKVGEGGHWRRAQPSTAPAGPA